MLFMMQLRFLYGALQTELLYSEGGGGVHSAYAF